MNRLKKIISFVLCFSICLLFNVSYAEFTSVPQSGILNLQTVSSFPSSSFGGYTCSQIRGIVINYLSDTTNESYLSVYNSMISSVVSDGFNISVIGVTNKDDYTYNLILIGKNTADFGIRADYSAYPYFLYDLSLGDYSYSDFVLMSCNHNNFQYPPSTTNMNNYLTLVMPFNTSGIKNYNIYYSSTSIKNIYYSSGYYWDGTYLYEAVEPDEPDTPSLPSNADIAKAVQAFYNSDYYKNNKDFEDFIVLYNYDTQYFDFIGHNFGIDLGQVIVPPDYKYEGYSYSQDWWKFFLRNISSEIASNLWNRYYWLYSTNDFGENITNNGKGSIKDLINLHFSTKSVIVYSTTDYPVVKIETDENGVLTPVEGTVPGDQYTYDENLDPTTNEYNPLENFVPTNPSQTILGDVDFDEINKTFEENKNILNIESASWLFTANNQLTNYFIGFLSLLIVFLIISRILGG